MFRMRRVYGMVGLVWFFLWLCHAASPFILSRRLSPLEKDAMPYRQFVAIPGHQSLAPPSFNTFSSEEVGLVCKV
jgi:hypothetical protein